MRYSLPDDIQVIVRDWLNANHVLLFGDTENVVFDSGHVTTSTTTVAVLRERLGGRTLHQLLNTHCHADHCGGNAAVKRAFGCAIAVPEGEADIVERWDTTGLWLDYSGQLSERFRFDRVIKLNDVFTVGNHTWTALAAPGHDMGAVMFWCEDQRVLVSGDALWEYGFGVVLAGPGFQERLQSAHETLERIDALSPQMVIPGHGEPFTNVAKAVAGALSRINAFAADEEKLARHVLKVMFSFSLLERQSMREDNVLALLENAKLYGEYDQKYFHMGLEKLGAWIVRELSASGVVERDHGWLRPAQRTIRG